MIMKDFRYILKKILIGIGIIIGVSMIKSCNVYALETIEYTDTNTGISVSFDLDTTTYPYYYLYRGYLNSTSEIHYVLAYSSNKPNSVCYSSGCQNYINTLNTNSSFYFSANNTTLYQKYKYYNMSGSLITSGQNTTGYTVLFTNNYESVMSTTHTAQDNVLIYSSYDFVLNGINVSKNYYNDNNFSPPNIPEIVSLNPQLNKTDDNMLVSVGFTIEFSYIDNENYDYYAWFEGNNKIKITENNFHMNTQNNTILYVEITDKNGNSIDTETYTVSSIGLIYNGNYDIQYKTEEYSESDTVNDSDALFDIINRIDIDITYIPKWINYKYYYQWVDNGQVVDENNWILVNNNSDKNNIVYTTDVNGVLYAKIEDNNGNLLKSSTYTITRIGSIKTYQKNESKFFTAFNNLKNQTNFGGPITSLLIIPVNVLTTIVQASTGTCSPYNLGSINGHNLTLNCINPEDYLGSSLWTTIDVIVSGCLCYTIMKWLSSLYYNFVTLKNTSHNEIGERGDL